MRSLSVSTAGFPTLDAVVTLLKVRAFPDLRFLIAAPQPEPPASAWKALKKSPADAAED